MSHPSTYKPSPLSYGSPRTSPFRRPESPASPFRRPESPSSPSTTIRPTTPTPIASPIKERPQSPLASPTKSHQTPLSGPSKLAQTTTTPTTDTTTSWTPRGLTPSLPLSNHSPQTSPTRTSSVATAIANHQPPKPNNDTISQLPPHQLHQMRESFQILDRDNDGLVNRNDVVDMLTNLGQPSNASDVTPFFPPGAPQTLPLPTFLSTLSSLLAPLSSQTELLNAFAAFDDHDTGEVDVGELRDAVLNNGGGKGLTSKEVEEAMGGFVGRKAFGKTAGGGARGEVFRYREWVGNVMGAGSEKADGEK